MIFEIYNKALTRIGIFDTFVSSVWEEQYSDKGTCQLVVNKVTAPTFNIEIGYWVGCSTKNTLWQIQTIDEQVTQIWYSGFTANYALLNDRVYDGTNKSNNVETTLRTAVTQKRQHSFTELAPIQNLTATVKSQHSYSTLFELSKDLCDAVGYGFKYLYDRDNKKLLYSVYEGETQTDAIFSEAYGNLSDIEIINSIVDFKNVAYVGGGGDGADRTFVVCGDTTSTDDNRHELYVDARDIQLEVENPTNKDIAEYENLLKERGLEVLNEYNKKYQITCEVAPDTLGKKYNLGDKIFCILQKSMLKLEIRVIGFREINEDNKITLEIILGTPIIKTLGRK